MQKTKSMYILGINAYHGDSSAALFKDGRLICAFEEERFTRIKHWAGFPAKAIQSCLDDAGITPDQLDYITIGRDPKANLIHKIFTIFRYRVNTEWLLQRIRNSKRVGSVEDDFIKHFPGLSKETLKAKIVNIEHHRSHLASAFFASPFQEAALLSIDGFGDFSSCMLGTGKDNQIEVIDSVRFPHSIGIFYSAFTQYLGFLHYGDEYKVMGLAPYGEPKYADQLRDILRVKPDGLFELNLDYFVHYTQGVKTQIFEKNDPTISILYSPAMESKFGTARKKGDELTQHHRDLAASVQKVTEETIFYMLKALHKRTGLDHLCIAGGVAQNSVANGKLLKNSPFKHIYIPSAGHDAGNAAGSALYHFNHNLKQPRQPAIYSAYTGSYFTNDFIETFLKGEKITYTKLDDGQLYETVADCLTGGGVVGWFQGRAEFGPRALGARSILADPRRTDAKDLLNSKIKRRESFRPFAPSILKEFVSEYFEITDEVPFMEKVFPIKKEKHSVIPAVTHVDGTGRLQTVDKNVSPRYYALISEFYRKTGVPVLLNTSFNENEPIVNSPAEALSCFLRTAMDMLVLENCVIKR